MNRTNNCGELTKSNLGQTVKLSGWVNKIREKGFIIWVDLRDRYGITQLVFDKERSNDEIFTTASQLGREFVIEVEGSVIERKSINENIDTGEIEILVTSINILNKSLTPPFTIENESDGGEELRMKYRYLDIRREPIKENLIFRHSLSLEVRNYLSENNFIDIETPCLIKSTPEGARDFIVPSRLNPDHYYALPQSPQIFKQLLMIGGIDKYYQIVKCFRDEDLRADRQPEFTQIDIEASFVDQDYILDLAEGMVKLLIEKFCNYSLDKFPVLNWHDSMRDYGCDKPDLRIPLKLVEISELVKNEEFKVFSGPAKDEGSRVVALKIPGGNNLSRGQIDEYTKFVSKLGAKGLAYIKVNATDGSENGLQSPILKFLDTKTIESIMSELNLEAGDLVFFGAGSNNVVNLTMSSLIKKLGEDLNLYDSEWAPCWIVNFPMFERNTDGNLTSLHHPFTLPKCTKEELSKDPDGALAHAYDIVLNGYEVGGGSLRIYDQDMQKVVFDLLNITKEEADILLNNDVNNVIIKLDTHWPVYKTFPEEAQMVVIDLVFNMGINTWLAFRKTRAYMELGEWEKAGDELLDSRYAKQVGRRAIFNSEELKKCQHKKPLKNIKQTQG